LSFDPSFPLCYPIKHTANICEWHAFSFISLANYFFASAIS
jgi:hypothetical protein